ncbi:MAG: hypothetical protein AAB361_01760 [Patescibacteria group bacterium]
MDKINLSKKILVSITGSKEQEWQDKLKEINKLKLKEVALFLELFKKPEREKIYTALLSSKIKSIPLVHIRHDMAVDELKFLKNNFKTKYFTVHEINFQQNDILKWKKFYKNLSLEMNTDNFVSKKINVEKIGGFCVDLAHFKVGMEKLSKDFEYVFNKKNSANWRKYFDCNHLNGYNPKTNCDMHTIYNLKDFDYLKTLPNFLFGKIIALETFNPIKEQLEFKKYLTNLLKSKIR